MPDRPPPTFRDAFRFWFTLGWISFGGPAGQIAIMQTELVERKRWIDQDRFLHALNYCMLLPGPEAQQLATYCGWLLHGTRGGLVAGTLFVLPGALVLWVLSVIYVTYGNVPVVAAIFAGIKPAVLAIVLEAVLRVGKKALKTVDRWLVAATAFVAIYFLGAPFPLIVLSAAIYGLLRTRFSRTSSSAATAATAREPHHGWGHAARVLAIGIPLWAAPIVIVALVFGSSHALAQEGIFFSKAAMVTVGGAYAVLPYVAQQAVETHAWLTAPQMLDGLAFAETTPGPLILVLQFVGFLGGWHQPGPLAPMVAGTLGAAITTWVTFVPCFIWIFLGAPHIERLRGHRWLTGALNAVTAAVVGVILNLAVWFAVPLLWHDGRIDWPAAIVTLAAFSALHRFKVNLLWVILAAGAWGVVRVWWLN